MALTILLSKVFGVYLVVIGAILMARRQYFTSVFAGFVEHKLLRMTIAIVQLLAGLFLIITHNEWTPLAAGIITFFGWAMAIEGAAYLVLSDRAVGKIIRAFNTKAWYIVGGLLAIVIGLYLISIGWDLNWAALISA